MPGGTAILTTGGRCGQEASLSQAQVVVREAKGCLRADKASSVWDVGIGQMRGLRIWKGGVAAAGSADIQPGSRGGFLGGDVDGLSIAMWRGRDEWWWSDGRRVRREGREA